MEHPNQATPTSSRSPFHEVVEEDHTDGDETIYKYQVQQKLQFKGALVGNHHFPLLPPPRSHRHQNKKNVQPTEAKSSTQNGTAIPISAVSSICPLPSPVIQLVPLDKVEQEKMVEKLNGIYLLPKYADEPDRFYAWEVDIQSKIREEDGEMLMLSFVFKSNTRHLLWKNLRRAAHSLDNFMKKPEEWLKRTPKKGTWRKSSCLDHLPKYPFTYKKLEYESQRLIENGKSGFSYTSPRN